MHESTMEYTNDDVEPISLAVEPYGERYEIPPGGRLRIVARGSTEGELALDTSGDRPVVYAWPTSTSKVYLGGDLVGDLRLAVPAVPDGMSMRGFMDLMFGANHAAGTDPTNLFPCACCGYQQLSEGTHDTFELCEICFWEDDPLQFKDPDMEGGANVPSLRQAQRNFAEFGACERRALDRVRAPGPSDRRSATWRPF